MKIRLVVLDDCGILQTWDDQQGRWVNIPRAMLAELPRAEALDLIRQRAETDPYFADRYAGRI